MDAVVGGELAYDESNGTNNDGGDGDVLVLRGRGGGAGGVFSKNSIRGSIAGGISEKTRSYLRNLFTTIIS